MAAELLPEELWAEIEPLLPPTPPRSPKGGRPPVSNRAALRGIIFVDRTGIPWQALPTEVFGASGSTCWRRFHERTLAGVWPRVQSRLLNRLGSLGGVDLSRAVADSQSVRAVKGGRTAAPTPPTAESPAANATC
jgi:transposase